MKYATALTILFIIIISACTTKVVQEGISITTQTDPPRIFAGSDTTVYVDIKNDDVKTLKNVFVQVFDTGSFEKKDTCEKNIHAMSPNQIETLECKLRAPSSINQPSVSDRIHTRVLYDKILTAAQEFDIVSEDWYQRQGYTLPQRPQTYIYNDGLVELELAFSEPLPFVYRNKRIFAHFTIRNIGNGIIMDIQPEDFIIYEENDPLFFDIQQTDIMQFNTPVFSRQGFESVLKCGKFQTLTPIGNVFPRITCEIILPDTDYLIGYQMIIGLKYRYEMRDSVSVEVMR